MESVSVQQMSNMYPHVDKRPRVDKRPHVVEGKLDIRVDDNLTTEDTPQEEPSYQRMASHGQSRERPRDQSHPHNNLNSLGKNPYLTLKRILFGICLLTLTIVTIMMNVALIKLENKNNDKNSKECHKWTMVRFCSYTNWTKLQNDTYVGQVETLAPRLNGTAVCKKISCMVLSSDKCYYYEDNLVFYTHSQCKDTDTPYLTLGVLSIMFLSTITIFYGIYLYEKPLYVVSCDDTFCVLLLYIPFVIATWTVYFQQDDITLV